MKRSLAHAPFIAVALTSSLAGGGIALAQEAAAPAPTGLIAKRCQEEMAKLCAGIEPGGGRLAKCLRGHEAELSEPCKTALVAGWRGPKGGMSAPAARTAEPAAAPPAAAPPPPPPAGAAPQPPKAAPAAGSRPRPGMGMNAPSEWGPMAGMRRTCSAEIAKLCREVKPGHGRIAVCLSEHPQDLSPPCKGSVEQVTHQMGAPMEMHKACADDVKKLCGDVQPGTGHAAFCLGEHSAELSADCKKQVTEMKEGWSKRSFAPRKGAAPVPAPAPARPGTASSAPVPPAPRVPAPPATGAPPPPLPPPARK